jgi:hypothetical protein
MPVLVRPARAQSDAPAVPPPAGMVPLPAHDPMRSEGAEQYAANGQELLDTFFSADESSDEPFLFGDAYRAADGADRDEAAHRERVARRAAELASYQRVGGPAMPFQIFDDLRFERRLAADGAFLWMGHWAGYAGHRNDEGLWAEASLWLDRREVVLTLSGVAPPAPDAGWAILTAWVDAVRVANGLAPLTTHDLDGVPVEIPVPAGCEQAPADPTPADPDALPIVAAFAPFGAPSRTALLARWHRGAADGGPVYLKALVAEERARQARAARFGDLAGIGDTPGAYLVDTVDGGDGLAAVYVVRPEPDAAGGAVPAAVLTGFGLIRIGIRIVELNLASRELAASDGEIARGWQLFSDWFAAVRRANGVA